MSNSKVEIARKIKEITDFSIDTTVGNVQELISTRDTLKGMSDPDRIVINAVIKDSILSSYDKLVDRVCKSVENIVKLDQEK